MRDRFQASGAIQNVKSYDCYPPHSSHTTRKKLIADSEVGFLLFGEKSNGRFTKSRAPAVGTYVGDHHERRLNGLENLEAGLPDT